MSLETLKSDLKSNIGEASRLSALSSIGDVVSHLKDVLWPTLEAVVDELAEVDECVGDMVTNSEDILQPETGAVFVGVVAGAIAVAGALKQRITRETEPDLYRMIDELEANCKEANAILKEIVLDEPLDDDADEEDEDDEDDDTAEGAQP